MYADDAGFVRDVLEAELERQWGLAGDAQLLIDAVDAEVAVLLADRAGYVRDLEAAIAVAGGIGAELGVEPGLVGVGGEVDPYEVAFGVAAKVEPVKGRTWGGR